MCDFRCSTSENVDICTVFFLFLPYPMVCRTSSIFDKFQAPWIVSFLYRKKTDYLPKTILCGFQQFGCNLTQTFTVICLQISSENKHKQIIISINWYSKHKSFVSNAYWCYNYLVIFHHYWILSISFALLQISFLFYLVTYSHPYFNL